MKKKSKKYIGIAKIGYDKTIKNNICVKYRFNDVDKFIKFLTLKFPSVAWINIYNKVEPEKNKLVYTWGNIKGLCKAY